MTNVFSSMPTGRFLLYQPLFLALFMSSCGNTTGDCTHHFVYRGKIDSRDSTIHPGRLRICFQNPGDVIANVEKNYFSDTAFVQADGTYFLRGNFRGPCGRERSLFSATDDASYIVLSDDSVITSGRLIFRDLGIAWSDADSTYTLSVPLIEIEKAIR